MRVVYIDPTITTSATSRAQRWISSCLGQMSGLWLIEAKAGKTVQPGMAAPLLSLQRALGKNRADGSSSIGRRFALRLHRL